VALSPDKPEQTRRIIDASLDRIGEGLRLLEDIARFVLDDAGLSRRLKELRHDLAVTDIPLKESLVQARKSAADIGADIEAPQQKAARDLPSLVVANSRRVQEALRVIEELAKLPASGLETAKYRQARFKIYGLEKELLSRLLRRDKAERINGLYGIVDTDSLGRRNHLEAAEAFIEGGAKVIQLRDKTSSHRRLFSIAAELKELCAKSNAIFIVNDYLDIALAVDADGLHIGQEDLPPAEARRLLPIDKLLGVSVTDTAEAREAGAAGADYLAAGAIYKTASKDDIRVIGLEELKRIRMATRLPLVAIGGIDKNNCAAVLEAGADALAVISAVLSAANQQQAAREIISTIKGCRKASRARANLN